MKMKTTMLLALLLALVCTAASAQEYYTLPEIREQAAAGWHETYTDKYGRQTAVDIDIQVFGDEKAPVLKIGLPDYQEYTKVENNPYLSVTNVKKRGGQRTIVYEAFGEKIDFDHVYGNEYGNNSTPGEAYSFLKKHLEEQGISSEGFVWETPKSFQVLCCTSQATGEAISAPFYFIRLWPELQNKPLLTHVMASFKKDGWPNYTPELTYMFRGEDEYAIGVSTFEEREMIEEDIPLCSLEKIIQSAKEQIEAGYIQNVISLCFGYVVYNDPSIQSKKPVSIYDVDYCYAVPGWVLECQWVDTPQMDYSDTSSVTCMAFNAQNGKMMNRFDKSKFGFANGDYQGCISWDDVR